MSKLVGAQVNETVVMNSLTTNLHLLMVAFYRPTSTRYKIILEDHAFPSDTVCPHLSSYRSISSDDEPSVRVLLLRVMVVLLQYAIKSQLAVHGVKEEDGLVLVSPRPGEDLIRHEDIIAAIQSAGDSLALVMFTGVQYYTGQAFDMQAITKAAHEVGAYAGFDLAHAVGNIPMYLHDWDVDFAAWCTYKYANSGPGGIAGAFLHSKYAKTPFLEMPFFAGWWGHRREDRFKMEGTFHPIEGAGKFQLSNPPVFQIASLRYVASRTHPALHPTSTPRQKNSAMRCVLQS